MDVSFTNSRAGIALARRSRLAATMSALLWLFVVIDHGGISANAADLSPAVATLLKAHCVKCHGPIKPKARLDLSSPTGLARGGESGAAVVAGKLDRSLLWQRVEAGEMPPAGALSDAEKAVLRTWILEGAAGIEASGAGHWAFLPLVRSPEPAVRDTGRVRNAVDRFVQARLERKRLGLGPDADLRTLVRRVSLDVTGLPPTPAEVDAFVNDTAPGAYERMVDRYLASQSFGERWGKHWLDAAGYADSNGYFSADTDRPLAYRYRDYVIQSLNADKPFDRFLREQLAGDELAQFRPGTATTSEAIELLIATHFLRNGQDGTDIGVQEPEAFEIDRRAALEAAVQVTASSLLGLTAHCARCHDHKFEPITQQEYYGLQAVLFPAFNPQDWVNPRDRIAYAYLPGEKETWEQNEQRIKAELTRIRTELDDWLAKHQEPSDLLFEEKFDDDGWRTRWSSTAPGDDKPGGTVSLTSASPNAAQVVDGALRVIVGPTEAWLSTAMAIDWTPEKTGDWVQVTFDLIDNKIGASPSERIGYTIAAHDFDDSGTTPGGNILVDGNPTTSTQLYPDYPGSDSKPNGQIGLQGYVAGRNYGVRVTNLGEGKFRLEHVVDGLQEGKSHEMTAADLPNGGFAFFYSSSRSYIVDNVRIERSLATPSTSVDVAALRKEIEAQRKTYDEQRKKLEAQRTKEPGRAIAWVTDKTTKPPTVPLLTRGLYHLRGPSVEPGALAMLTDAGHEYQTHALPSDATTTGRRLGFANWLLRSEGRPAALVARVHVNRIWREYFGSGIVATTDNLGQSGAPPTHPELINELATSFIQSKWSQKSVHRQILLSTTYRQSSAPRGEAIEVEPDNRLYWRFPVRRLQAEAIRDSMLAISGQLDATPFGPYVVTRQTAVGEVVVNPQEAGARRRSIYLQQRRSQTLSMLKVFDAPAIATVCTTRPSSTVPLQSLFLLNSEFAVVTAEAFARRLLAETDGTDAALIQRAWLLAVARTPTATEQQISAEFLAGQRAQYTGQQAVEWGLADFCQMLLASNAFLYLE
jgi:mono/diheme cytochrome c family protein